MTSFLRSCLPRISLALALGAATLILTALPAAGVIDASLQMQLGNPTGATADTNNYIHYLIQRPVEAIDYNATLGQANWVSWDLTAGDDSGAVKRSSTYYTDTNLPPNFYRVTGSGWSRGHMCPSADRTDTRVDNDMVFLFSNLIPQAQNLNGGLWEQLEDYCRSLADSGDEVLVMCGPSQFTGATFASSHVAVPGYNWKIAVIVPPGSGNAASRINYSTRVIAIYVTNSDSVSGAWANFVTSVNDLQTQTGFTFFTALPPNLAAVLRRVVDGQTPPAPAILGFSPASGSAGTSVTITGSNLNFTTNVTVNGASASFSILSSSNLTATVPDGATSGQIAVATLGGNANSAASFIVGTITTPDLAVSATHSGTFTQGDSGDAYTLIVTNIGTAASTGSVSVVDSLPAGLTATGLSGTGWSTDLGTLTCTRADALLAGEAYPPITLTVNVAASAPASLTNTAVVSEGDDGNPSNNSATDATTIAPAAAPTATTGSASSVGTFTAILGGTVNPNGQPATAHFDYGLTTNYDSTAAVGGNLTGTTAQGVAASLTGLTAGTSYHFRVAATNILGSTTGLDQIFATASAGVSDLAVSVAHTGNFRQGDDSDTYSIIVTNVGTAASSGTITVMDALPAGFTATDISGSGWTPDLGTLTCTRSDSLAANAGYPAITVTVNVSTNAPGSVTNIAMVSGGGETNLDNDTASDPTAINSGGPVGTITTLVGWDVSALSNYGPSPFLPTTNAENVSVVGLTRGSGVGTAGSAAGRAWGGAGWTDTSSAAAISANRFATFSVAGASGYQVSFASISRFDYRHSGTGPTNGLLQYQIGTGAFSNITTISYPSNNSSGASLSPIDLSGFGDLQNVGAGTNVTFRIVNWGGGSGGTWYIFDVAGSSAPDFVIQGTVSPVVAPVADLTISMSHNGDFTQGDTGQTYTIVVTNSGPGATAGAVSVTNILPAGLIATAIGGNGWTYDLSTLACTRSDTLAPGAVYPAITLTVSVLANAPASLTNLATVWGGGEANTEDNLATDPTAVLPAAAPTASTQLATVTDASTATLSGVVNPNGQLATAQFEYGLTPGYGAVLPIPGTLSGTAPQAVEGTLSGLLPGTTYHFRIDATNVLGTGAGQDETFTTLTPIEAWRLQWFGTAANSGVAADTATPTSDGIPNLLKYALGLNPLVATNDPVTGDITTGYLRLTSPKNPQATDVSFQVEATTDLTTGWTTNGTTMDTNTATLLQAHQNTPVATSEGGFIRLRVSRP